MRWLVPALGTALAIGALFWLYRDLDFDRFVTGLATAEPWWLLALAGTILAEQLLRGWKWRQILYDLKPISSWRLFGAILAGYGVGTLVPLGISPIVRSWLIARLENLRLASVLVTAAIERFIDGIVFAMIVGAVALAGRIPNIEEACGPVSRSPAPSTWRFSAPCSGSCSRPANRWAGATHRSAAPSTGSPPKAAGGWPASGRRSPRASSGRAPARGDGA